MQAYHTVTGPCNCVGPTQTLELQECIHACPAETKQGQGHKLAVSNMAFQLTIQRQPQDAGWQIVMISASVAVASCIETTVHTLDAQHLYLLAEETTYTQDYRKVDIWPDCRLFTKQNVEST